MVLFKVVCSCREGLQVPDVVYSGSAFARVCTQQSNRIMLLITTKTRARFQDFRSGFRDGSYFLNDD